MCLLVVFILSYMIKLVPYFIYFLFEELSKMFSQFFVTWCIWHWIWLVASSDFTDQFEQFSGVIRVGFNYFVWAVILSWILTLCCIYSFLLHMLSRGGLHGISSIELFLKNIAVCSWSIFWFWLLLFWVLFCLLLFPISVVCDLKDRVQVWCLQHYWIQCLWW